MGGNENRISYRFLLEAPNNEVLAKLKRSLNLFKIKIGNSFYNCITLNHS